MGNKTQILENWNFQCTEKDYESYVNILSQCWPDESPPSVEEVEFGDSQWRKEKLFNASYLNATASQLEQAVFLSHIG